jgi:hypothetical protein
VSSEVAAARPPPPWRATKTTRPPWGMFSLISIYGAARLGWSAEVRAMGRKPMSFTSSGHQSSKTRGQGQGRRLRRRVHPVAVAICKRERKKRGETLPRLRG